MSKLGHVGYWMLLTTSLTVSIILAQTELRSVDGTSPRGEALMPVTAQGRALRAFLDGMAVDRYWLRSNERILWETGEPKEVQDGKILPPLPKDETHCSAFVAAAAERLGIYVLRPPQHSHILLANAQFDWLASAQGVEKGWRVVATPLEAQASANRGEFVVAVVKNPDPKQAGHIAVVAPCEKPVERVLAEGPQICQAGFRNLPSAPLQEGFDRHPGAWSPGGEGAVRFYRHPLGPEQLGGVDYSPTAPRS